MFQICCTIVWKLYNEIFYVEDLEFFKTVGEEKRGNELENNQTKQSNDSKRRFFRKNDKNGHVKNSHQDKTITLSNTKK